MTQPSSNASTPATRATPASPAAPAPTKPAKDPQSTVKETVESILVAFILAFIFRAFLVEAFVIPTGSMAPTLLGAHMRFRCPNCGFRISTIPSSDPETNASHPPVYYGDRILVLKYLYLFEKPQRWDVVVFKSPDREINGPPTYTQNYIK